MPVKFREKIHILSQRDFAEIAYDVMAHAFHIHNTLGRFFDEQAYLQELAYMLGPRAITEVDIHISFADFSKTYFIDLLVDQGAIFELKTVNQLTNDHRSQLLNYLFLTGCRHGKLINFRPDHVMHEFINTSLTHADRTCFVIDDSAWDHLIDRAMQIRIRVEEFLREWGTGLDLKLYVDALTHFLGGENDVIQKIDIVSGNRCIGQQRVYCAGKDTVFKFTALSNSLENFEVHALRFLRHSNLKHMLWINVTHQIVTMKTLTK